MEEQNMTTENNISTYYPPEIAEYECIQPKESIFSQNTLTLKSISEEFDSDERQRKASSANEDNIMIIQRREDEVRYERIEYSEEQTEVQHTVTIKTDKYKYIGEVAGNKREGFGICYYNKGEIYVGQWKEDKQEGYGKTIFPDGEIYQGEISGNKYNGFCESIQPKRQISIQGYAINNSFMDEVVIKEGSKTIMCAISNDFTITNSLAKIIYSDAHYYIGEVNPTLVDGFGISIFKNNFIYSGDVKSFKSNGYGEVFYNDGSRYYGYFRDNKKHGFGFQFTKDGKMIYGFYDDDIKCGPFVTVNKTNYKVDIYHLGLKSKTVEKVDNCKKYINLNYPEFTFILKINFKFVYEKMLDVLPDEDLKNEVLVVNEI
jgi:hypothetical protein